MPHGKAAPSAREPRHTRQNADLPSDASARVPRSVPSLATGVRYTWTYDRYGCCLERTTATPQPERFAVLRRDRRLVFSTWNTMTVAKFAISVPEETMSRVDLAAKRLGMTRSGYIAAILARVARHERNNSISKKVDEVLADLDQQDLDAVRHFSRARRNEGTEW
jgi:hypothetical protein